MHGTVLTRLRMLATSAISNVTTLIQSMLSTLTGVLATLATQCVRLSSLLALIAQKCKALLASLTTLESSTNQEPTNAQAKAGQDGQQQATTAQPTPQPAVRTLKQNQTLVDRTKSGKFAAKGTGAVQTPMERQRQADGKFKKTHVGLPHQRAKSQSKKGK